MSTTALEEEFIPSLYVPPSAAVTIGSILRAPRTIRHNGNFTLLFSLNRQEQVDYVNGLLVVEVVFLSIFVLWVFVLVVLKIKGKEVGCASGRAFVTVGSDDDDDFETDFVGDETRQTEVIGDRAESLPSDEFLDSTSDSSGDNHSFSHLDERSLDDDGEQLLDLRTPNSASTDEDDEDHGVWKPSSASAGKPKQLEGEVIPNGNQLPAQPRINKREFRTRISFLFFAALALICVPLILVLCLGPMRDAAQSSDDIILAIRGTASEVQDSLQAIELNSINAFDVVDSTPTDLQLICPNVEQSDLESVLGIDLMDIIETISNEYYSLKDKVSSQLETGNAIVEQVNSYLTTFEVSVNEAENYLWIIPGLLFVVGVLTAISSLGVILAWRDRSGQSLQRIMSWIVLPLLILSMIACWVVVMMASFSSMVGSDICTSSSSNGSPDQTIQQILSLHQSKQNSTLYQMVNAYTNQCMGSDPIQQIQDLEGDVQAQIDTIWRQMSQVDSLGRAEVMELCGGQAEAFTDLLTGARNLAKLLTAIRRALDNTERSLKCTIVNPTYVQAAHEAVCTDTLTASVYGFIFFFVLSICVMVMISLRASWLRHTEEEKIYHDEDDVAENMILDEHEEYLAYISRFKHEWQEYEGFENEASAIDSNEDYLGEEEASSRYSGSDEEESTISDMDMRSPTTGQEAFQEDGASLVSADYSFPSLSDQTKSHDEAHLAIPPPLLPARVEDNNDGTAPLPASRFSFPNNPTYLSSTSTSRSTSLLVTRPNHPLARRSLERIQRPRSSLESSAMTPKASGEVEASAFGPGFAEL